jgi:hypothetical protein
MRKQMTSVSGRVLTMLYVFFETLCKDSHPAAMAVLVEGGAVELTVGHVAEAGLDIPRLGLEMFCLYVKDPAARDRMSAPQVVNQLIQWIAKWLPEVRTLTITPNCLTMSDEHCVRYTWQWIPSLCDGGERGKTISC